jgi:predicted CoA-substrate-specific enzyme activase
MMKMRKTAGICIGSTTVQAVVVSQSDKLVEVVSVSRILHDGTPDKVVKELFRQFREAHITNVVVTGRTFRKNIQLTSISEPLAIECALRQTYPQGDYPAIVISSGGETLIVYSIGKNGGITSVHSGNKCASGTGEFFLQQIRRMGLELDDAITLAQGGVAHRIAGRCSVFCKSDCTHALNKGESRANIVAGLCLMMADKVSDLVKKLNVDSAVFIGGGSLNAAVNTILTTRFARFDIPQYSSCFEAYGAALYALENECMTLGMQDDELIKIEHTSFGKHLPLRNAMQLVEFREQAHSTVRDGDRCVVGLDVGSTTTKAILMRVDDSSILGSVYLRTNGDPVEASRQCYKELLRQTGGVNYTVSGLGVTGSGRQIAGLHALSNCVVNEIVAHATAAVYFDRDVDTIFEIGGQDAKYTLLSSGIPSDYAMNEACSAGTGSFLEEAARESLNITTEQIGECALRGENPPDFTDQCAAFISSDIKLAGQEGIQKDDILAGLVYSICLNYLNRVKGSRAVGKKIFMQGGVCYNKAVPVAMAALMNAKVIVPPDPGLMGAFGVALETGRRLESGLIAEEKFDLKALSLREAVSNGTFRCNGGGRCDRSCEIKRLKIDNKNYLFGGICNRFYNLRLKRSVVTEKFDLVALRQKLLFEKYGVKPVDGDAVPDKPAKTVGLMNSFIMHSLYPLYSNFFSRMGFNIVFADTIDQEGISRKESEFCLPAEIAHGSFYTLLKKNPDFIFLPQVMQVPVPNVKTYSRLCVFVQGEPYYLKTTFREELEQSPVNILSPVIKRMEHGYEAALDTMIDVARSMGVSENVARNAYLQACSRQREFEKECIDAGKKVIEYLEANDDIFGIVLFGRPYNSFTRDANMGIPDKTASRGYFIIPHDMLPSSTEAVDYKMFWANGQKIMKSAAFVSKKKNLFGFYITNFSCGPDSFLLNFFRREMGAKPSLTLELDQHTADAGIDTRIEAALDIMTAFYHEQKKPAVKKFRKAEVVFGKHIEIIDSDDRRLPLRHKDVQVILPSMGKRNTTAVAAILRANGLNAIALPVSDREVLLTGRKSTTCKECLPYILTTGSFMNYIRTRTDEKKVSLFFLPTGGGPCRLGQYCRALDHLIEKEQLKNVAVFVITDENGYAGLGASTLLRAWLAMVTGDVFEQIRSTVAVAAENPPKALELVEEVWSDLLLHFEGKYSMRYSTFLSNCAQKLSTVKLKKSHKEIPTVSLIGEIYVRQDEFSRKNIVDYLENEGIRVRIAPVSEYLCYSNFVVNTGLGEREFSFKEKIKMRLTAEVQQWWETRIKSILGNSGLYHPENIDIEKTIHSAEHLMDQNFRGETILTVGLGIREILHDCCGVISIGPFGCMPSRMAESILKKEMTIEGKLRAGSSPQELAVFDGINKLPFLAIETDGSPFPQLVEANMEAFVIQAKRIHELMMKARHKRFKKQNVLKA